MGTRWLAVNKRQNLLALKKSSSIVAPATPSLDLRLIEPRIIGCTETILHLMEKCVWMEGSGVRSWREKEEKKRGGDSYQSKILSRGIALP